MENYPGENPRPIHVFVTDILERLNIIQIVREKERSDQSKWQMATIIATTTSTTYCYLLQLTIAAAVAT